MTPDEALAVAWTLLAPNREREAPFPRGFWPDVARVAMAAFVQNTVNPSLDFRPTRCDRGNYPEPARKEPKASRGKISSAAKAANTAALLAALRAGAGNDQTGNS